MTYEELFKEKAASGYTVCCVDTCPLREECLRWLVWQQMSATRATFSCVNPKYEGVGTECCAYHRNARKVMMARGMTQIFTDDMPKRVEQGVRNTLIERYNRAYYFEYRNGKRIIPPLMQEEIRQVFRDFGWNAEVEFDGYVEDFDW
jgi:hypothetical protein